MDATKLVEQIKKDLLKAEHDAKNYQELVNKANQDIYKFKCLLNLVDYEDENEDACEGGI